MKTKKDLYTYDATYRVACRYPANNTPRFMHEAKEKTTKDRNVWAKREDGLRLIEQGNEQRITKAQFIAFTHRGIVPKRK